MSGHGQYELHIRGEPIVNTPQNAVHCFLNTGMDRWC